jgi:hypothetical protein
MRIASKWYDSIGSWQTISVDPLVKCYDDRERGKVYYLKVSSNLVFIFVCVYRLKFHAIQVEYFVLLWIMTRVFDGINKSKRPGYELDVCVDLCMLFQGIVTNQR